ncbi:MAG: hypothetical protein Q6361_07820, partial [Candidatus Hermodarchaeota archaeon]|nr:hypothetical protein [Candidatus Hermodarchaeota archaeon]
MNDEQKKVDAELVKDVEVEDTAFERVFWQVLTQLGWALGSIFLALLVAALIMIATGSNPLVAF